MRRKIAGLIGMISLAALPCFASAADVSLAVSCSIPAVPGLNAPLLVETAAQPENQNIAPVRIESEDESPATLQEDSDGQIVLANGKTAGLTVQTVYSR